MREWFRVEAAAKGKGGGKILIYSHIGKRWSNDTEAVDAKAFVEGLNGLVSAGPGEIVVCINSPGGDVGAGMTIYNALRAVRNRVVCRVEGYAYSMASVIALAGRETHMSEVGQFMVHNPTTFAWGGQKEMERAIAALKTARATLIKAYSKKTGKPSEEIEALMDETTFMTAEEAKEFGFVDVIVDGEEVAEGQVAACFDAGAWAAYWMGSGPMPVDSLESGVRSLEEEAHAEALRRKEVGEVDRVDRVDRVDGGQAAGGSRGDSNNTGGDAPKEETKVMAKLTAKEIREACPGASAEFVLAQVEACEADENRGLVDVLKAHNGELVKAQADAQARAVAAEEAAKKAPVTPVAGSGAVPGVAPLASSGAGEGSGGDGDGDPVEAFEEAVSAHVAKGKSRGEAIREVVVRHPELHAAYVAAYNAAHGARRRAV